MDRYSEIRRVRKVMSKATGVDLPKLAALTNACRHEVADYIIAHGAIQNNALRLSRRSSPFLIATLLQRMDDRCRTVT